MLFAASSSSNDRPQIISIAVNVSSLFTGSLHEIQVFDMKGQAFRESGWKPVRTLTGHKGHWVHGLLLHGEYLISSSNNLIKVGNKKRAMLSFCNVRAI